jgi:hypothetical protein
MALIYPNRGQKANAGSAGALHFPGIARDAGNQMKKPGRFWRPGFGIAMPPL